MVTLMGTTLTPTLVQPQASPAPPSGLGIRLFHEPGKKFGLDLVALNIQRGREHGIPSYNRWREWCGLHPMNTWDDLLGVMANHSVKGYSELYASPEDMDLWTAGISERPLPASLESSSTTSDTETGSGMRVEGGLPPSLRSSWLRSGGLSSPPSSVITPMTSRTSRCT